MQGKITEHYFYQTLSIHDSRWCLKVKLLKSREGVIIECSLNGQYHDARDVILTSRTDVREMVDDDDDDEWPLVIYNYITSVTFQRQATSPNADDHDMS